MERARFYEKTEDGRVHCNLCPHNCVIREGGLGICKTRKNTEGELFTLNYGKIASLSLDPIEKKPLNRFHPGSRILSVGTFGCNLKCAFCQNWTIAHEEPDTMELGPEKLVEKAVEFVPHGNIGLAFTYNEPSIWYEYVYDTSKLAHEKGLKNVLVTNGYISTLPLKEMIEYIDAMNIDLKAFTRKFYNEVCMGGLDSVMNTIEFAATRSHVEITTLVVPGKNDSTREIGELSKWLSNISKNIPLHLSRFFPNYKMKDIPPTPLDTMVRVREEAQKYLKYVYLGNV